VCGGCKAKLSLNYTQVALSPTPTEHCTAMIHILGVQLFENNFVKVGSNSCLILDIFLTDFSACFDPFLRNKPPHLWSHLRSPPDPRHLPRSPALPNANHVHRRLPLLSCHLAHPAAWPSRVPHLPARASVHALTEPARRTRIPRAARRTPSAAPAS